MARPNSEQNSNQTGGLGQKYLFLYNFLQVVGWSHVLYKTLEYHATGNDGHDLWTSVNPSLTIFQSAAALEILNVAIGLVRSNLINTTFQVLSRLMVLWINLIAVPSSRESYGLPLLLLAWSITEIIRYSFYACGFIGRIPHFLTWARYTFFYVLYPIGVTGETLVIVACIPFAREQKPFTYELPNAFNFTFSYLYFLYFALALYVLIFPMLYKHMIMLRRKVLGDVKIKTK